MSDQYSIREHLEDVDRRICQRLERLEVKVDATNGRVSDLELWRAELRGAKMLVVGAVSAATAFVFSLLASALSTLLGK